MDSVLLLDKFGPWGVVAILLFVVLFWHKQQNDALVKTFGNHLSEDIKALQDIHKTLAEDVATHREHHEIVVRALETIEGRQVLQLTEKSRAKA